MKYSSTFIGASFQVIINCLICTGKTPDTRLWIRYTFNLQSHTIHLQDQDPCNGTIELRLISIESSYLNQSINVRELVVCVRLVKYFLISATVSVSYSSQDDRRNSFSSVGVQESVINIFGNVQATGKAFSQTIKGQCTLSTIFQISRLNL